MTDEDYGSTLRKLEQSYRSRANDLEYAAKVLRAEADKLAKRNYEIEEVSEYTLMRLRQNGQTAREISVASVPVASKSTTVVKLPESDLVKRSNYHGYLRPYLDKIVALYAEGNNFAAIIRALGPVNPGYGGGKVYSSSALIRQVLIKCGVELRPMMRKGKSAVKACEREAEALRLRSTGLTLKQVGEHFGVSGSRAGAMVAQAWRRERAREHSARSEKIIEEFLSEPRNLGRPIDMGGPRDEWIEGGVNE